MPGPAMRLLDCDTAAAYLQEIGLVDRGERLDITPLSGGVSNLVLLVRREETGREPFVLKQARAQLRVPQPWFCAVERMLREIDVLRVIEPLVAELNQVPLSRDDESAVQVHTPRILWEDRENFALVMTAAPVPHATWKERLLAGDLDEGFADAVGRLLGWLHGRTWQDPGIAAQFDDRTFFDDLRIDPYYRQIAHVHSDLATPIQDLIDQVASHRRCLVHGDFSPKNLLVWDRQLMLIDFEVGHYGDPAFDLGFLLTHLVLKAFYHGRSTARGRQMLELTRRFWSSYRAPLDERISADEWSSLEYRAIINFAGCMLARVDGKSRVDYLPDPQPVRELARRLFLETPHHWQEVVALIGEGP